jgi:hypothetical protein
VILVPGGGVQWFIVVSLDDNCALVSYRTARSTVFDRTPDWRV